MGGMGHPGVLRYVYTHNDSGGYSGSVNHIVKIVVYRGYDQFEVYSFRLD